ncbi:MAG: alpha/beta fold hydrolase, partial [Bryobacteraceae bacterium]
MSVPEYYPYRSAALRDAYFAHYDSLAAKEWPVASEARMVPTTRGGTFVRISGPASAPPLVLLPGAAATSLMWAPNVQALSAEYRTFAVDQIGEIGRSVCTQPIQSLSDHLSWLNELFDALELGDGINLAGLSYGGALTAQYALHFPKRVNKAVLLAPGNTVLRVRTEFYVRVILAAIAKRRFLPQF